MESQVLRKLGSVFYHYAPSHKGTNVNIRINSRFDLTFQLVYFIANQGIENVYRQVVKTVNRNFSVPDNVTDVYLAVTSGLDSTRTNVDIIFTETNQQVSDLFITPWNSASGKRYHSDPYAGQWNWVSPDIAIDKNKVSIVVHNLGNGASKDFTIQIYSVAASSSSPRLLKSLVVAEPIKPFSSTKVELTLDQVPSLGDLAVTVQETGSNVSLACTGLLGASFGGGPVLKGFEFLEAKVTDEVLYRFEFAILPLLLQKISTWNVSLLYYSKPGPNADGILLVGIPERDRSKFEQFFKTEGFNFSDETSNPAYRKYLI